MKFKRAVISANSPLFSPSGARVPPGWTHIWMTDDPQDPLQVTGRDSKGRRVYLYSVEYMGRATAAKFSRLKDFAKAYPSLIKNIRRDMKTLEEALVLYLIAKTGFRIGSGAETKAAVRAFGASTLRCSQVNINGNKLSFDFIGKKGIRVYKVIKDRDLAAYIAPRCDQHVDHKIFRTTDDKIRRYLNSISKGSEFTVKDFRTYFGTLKAFHKIQKMPLPKNMRENKRYRREVAKTVASELGNSPPMALKSYIAPEVFCSWEPGLTPDPIIIGKKRFTLTDALLECVHYDQKVGKEEFRDSDPMEKNS